MPRLFVPRSQFPDLTGSDIHYIKDVLRLRPGDRLELLDGSGTIYQAEIGSITKERVACKIISSAMAESEPRTKVTLAQALPKAGKMDFIIEKGVELGVNMIVPLTTERTVAKTAKLDRWRKLAKEAAEQSGRAVIPEITELTDLASVLDLKTRYDLALIPWELERANTLKSILSALSLTPAPLSLIILIGPEGGFSQKEVEQAKAAGFQPVSLGKRILRTETAGLAVLANIIYELG